MYYHYKQLFLWTKVGEYVSIVDIFGGSLTFMKQCSDIQSLFFFFFQNKIQLDKFSSIIFLYLEGTSFCSIKMESLFISMSIFVIAYFSLNIFHFKWGMIIFHLYQFFPNTFSMWNPAVVNTQEFTSSCQSMWYY